jgi:hypothetical protein
MCGGGQMKKQMMACVIASSVLGLTLSNSEIAQAQLRTCPGAAAVAGIDFSDCKMMSVGNPAPNVEVFKLSMTNQLSVVVAQYNTNFAVAYGPKTVNGLIAVRYDSNFAQVTLAKK